MIPNFKDEAQRSGWMAHAAGLQLSANPFAESDERASSWRSGFEWRQAILRNEKA
jgi:hypothetical protein